MVTDEKWRQLGDVMLISKDMVLPAQPTRRHPMFLPSLDVMWQDVHYNRRLVFYEAASGTAGEQAVMMEKLKSSLAMCLVHYYPWCGRIAGPRDRLIIDCNDAGVEFVQARTDVPLRQLSEGGYKMTPFFEKLCQHVEHTGDCLFSSPLLSVQATLFCDNGLALGIAQSHIVADGQSLWNFMVSWGECARGISPLSLPPIHDREILALKETPCPSKASTNVDTMLEGEESTSKSEKRTEEGTDMEAKHEKETLVQCVFNLPSTAIKKLKEEAGGRFSTYEVICAHFWKHVTVARGGGDDEATGFVVLANCRSRLVPPLPSAYFGNVIMPAIASSSRSDITRGTLSSVAERIHGAVATCREDSLQALTHWLELHGNRLIPSLSWKDQSMNVASSTRFPVYQVDFGWGKPAAVRSVQVVPDGEIVLFGGSPRLGSGDVEVCCALSEGPMKRLLEDPHFLAKPPP